ncbi:ATP-dependent DNA ligase [Klebsiella phage IME184]|nr:ATP-dependent DNA ligase [Klebsiella phage IME184]
MVSYDLTCIGWEEGKGKYKGKVANLIFKWKGGKTVKAMLGKGWTHEDAERMYHDIKHGGELNVIGKIFAVKALQESSKGVLRLPKAGELRHDKEEPDVF